MKKHQQQKMHIWSLIGIVAFILLVSALVASALVYSRNPSFYDESPQPLLKFSYEISESESGEAVFHHTFKNLEPNTEVNVTVPLEPTISKSIMVKTVYTQLKLYATSLEGEETLIYACGQSDDYPSWMLDPPTLLQIVPVPKNAVSLRFEYISPSQRTAMSMPTIMMGSERALIDWLFRQNSAILIISIFLMIVGIILFISSLFSKRGNEVFLHLGLFAFAVGC